MLKMALAKSQNAPYKTVRPKLNVSQNKSLILFTQGTPTPSRHGAFGNPIGSLGLARDQVSFTTPGVGSQSSSIWSAAAIASLSAMRIEVKSFPNLGGLGTALPDFPLALLLAKLHRRGPAHKPIDRNVKPICDLSR